MRKGRPLASYRSTQPEASGKHVTPGYFLFLIPGEYPSVSSRLDSHQCANTSATWPSAGDSLRCLPKSRQASPPIKRSRAITSAERPVRSCSALRVDRTAEALSVASNSVMERTQRDRTADIPGTSIPCATDTAARRYARLASSTCPTCRSNCRIRPKGNTMRAKAAATATPKEMFSTRATSRSRSVVH